RAGLGQHRSSALGPPRPARSDDRSAQGQARSRLAARSRSDRRILQVPPFEPLYPDSLIHPSPCLQRQPTAGPNLLNFASSEKYLAVHFQTSPACDNGNELVASARPCSTTNRHS